MEHGRNVRFRIDSQIFEYDEIKNRINIEKHGISFENAALVFIDRQRIEIYDERHSLQDEDRFTTIGAANIGKPAAGKTGTAAGK